MKFWNLLTQTLRLFGIRRKRRELVSIGTMPRFMQPPPLHAGTLTRPSSLECANIPVEDRERYEGKSQAYYRGMKAQNPWQRKGVRLFTYRIAHTIGRLHANPPLWSNYHHHDFQIIVEICACMMPGDLYAGDMIQLENLLKKLLNELPEKLNEHPALPNGTTEQLAVWVAENFPLPDPSMVLRSVTATECPERQTVYHPNTQGEFYVY